MKQLIACLDFKELTGNIFHSGRLRIMSKDFIATQEALHNRAVFPGMNEKLIKCQFESRLRGRLRIPPLFTDLKL